ncbi:putative uncharacterized protein DDB_G0287457 isoform X2 [Maniola hyperantus]|uniref:putative uncharacterized protein DDB_G0287457 isoform X2 n=1 Tax=Aphantopus hyperantus TaxID=2795564 RepID=UPI0037497BC5
MNAIDAGSVVQRHESEPLCLLAEDNNEVYVDNFLLEQHQIDGLRFLFNQFNKKSPGVIVNFPPSCGKSATVAIFLNAVTNVLKNPVLIICRDDSALQYWKEILLKWSSYVEDDIAVESSNAFIKGKKVFLKKREYLYSYLRRRWSIVIIKESVVSKDVFKLGFEADFKMCITATDIKKDAPLLTAVYNWLYPKSKKADNVTEIRTNMADDETNRKGPLKNKDATGTKVKRSKITKDGTTLSTPSNQNDEVINELSGQAFIFINDLNKTSNLNDNLNSILMNDQLTKNTDQNIILINDQLTNNTSDQNYILINDQLTNNTTDQNFILMNDQLTNNSDQNFILTNDQLKNNTDQNFILMNDQLTNNTSDQNYILINDQLTNNTTDQNFILMNDQLTNNSDQNFILTNDQLKNNTDQNFILINDQLTNNTSDQNFILINDQLTNNTSDQNFILMNDQLTNNTSDQNFIFINDHAVNETSNQNVIFIDEQVLKGMSNQNFILMNDQIVNENSEQNVILIDEQVLNETLNQNVTLTNNHISNRNSYQKIILKDDQIVNEPSDQDVILIDEQVVNETSIQDFILTNNNISNRNSKQKIISKDDQIVNKPSDQDVILIDEQVLNETSNRDFILTNKNMSNKNPNKNTILTDKQLLNYLSNKNVVLTNNHIVKNTSDQNVSIINDDDKIELNVSIHTKNSDVCKKIRVNDTPKIHKNDDFNKGNINTNTKVMPLDNGNNRVKLNGYKSPINNVTDNLDTNDDQDSFKLEVENFICDQKPLKPVNLFIKLSRLYEKMELNINKIEKTLKLKKIHFNESLNIDNDSKVDPNEVKDLDDKDLLKEQLIESLHLDNSKVEEETKDSEEVFIKEEPTEDESLNENSKLNLNEMKDLKEQLIESLGFDSDCKVAHSKIKNSESKNTFKVGLNERKDIRNKCLLQKQLIESLGLNSDFQEIKQSINENNNNELNECKDFEKTLIKQESTESLSLGSDSKVDQNEIKNDINVIKEESAESLNFCSNSKVDLNEMKDLHNKTVLQKQLIESLGLDVKPEIKDEENDDQNNINENMQTPVQETATNLEDGEIIVMKIESEDGNETHTESDVNKVSNKRKSDVSDKDLDNKILEMEEKALKKFKGSFLDSIF